MLEVVRRDVGDVVVLALSGQIVGGAGDSLHRAIDTILAEGRHKVLLSMSDVSWISSSGLGELVASFSAVKKAGGKLKLAELSKRVELIISISKLPSMLMIYPTEAAAMAEFGEAPKDAR